MREVEALTKQLVTKMELPTTTEIIHHRESKTVENLKVWLGRGRFKRELEMVQELIEAGHDPLNIAAAAIKIARADEKQRPIAEVAEVKPEFSRKPERGFGRGEQKGGKRGESAGRREFGQKPRRGDSHEEGMIRLKINKGKAHNIRPNDIVGQIAFHANIPGHTIGKIRIEDKYSFVDVPEEFVDQVIKHSGNYKIGKEKFSVVKG
jgi:ATP-dependent RNA helicase DeaD